MFNRRTEIRLKAWHIRTTHTEHTNDNEDKPHASKVSVIERLHYCTEALLGCFIMNLTDSNTWNDWVDRRIEETVHYSICMFQVTESTFGSNKQFQQIIYRDLHYMNALLIVQNLFGLFLGTSFKRRHEMLRKQQQLLKFGKITVAEVLQVRVEEERIGILFPMKLWLNISYDKGRSEIIQANTLAPLDHLPEKGKSIQIKYLPNDPGTVLLI